MRRSQGYHCEGPVLNELNYIQLTTGFEHSHSPRHQARRQQNICRDHQVAGRRVLQQIMIRRLQARADPHCVDKPRGRQLQHPVGNQCNRYLQPLGGPEHNRLDEIRTGIRVDPYFGSVLNLLLKL